MFIAFSLEAFVHTYYLFVLTHPKIIHHLADSLVLLGDFLREVLIETWFDGEAFGKWRPVVFFNCQDRDNFIPVRKVKLVFKTRSLQEK